MTKLILNVCRNLQSDVFATHPFILFENFSSHKSQVVRLATSILFFLASSRDFMSPTKICESESRLSNAS
jgi:hypothetical protein